MNNYPIELFAVFGIVACAWAFIGLILSSLWEPALYLAIPVVVWGAVVVLVFAVGIPLLVIHDYVREGL